MKPSIYINPFEPKAVRHWMRKWDITQAELYNAILDTGSNNITVLKKNLKSKGMYLFPMGKIMHDFICKVRPW